MDKLAKTGTAYHLWLKTALSNSGLAIAVKSLWICKTHKCRSPLERAGGEDCQGKGAQGYPFLLPCNQNPLSIEVLGYLVNHFLDFSSVDAICMSLDY